MPLSEKFDEALVYAHELHRDQSRKGGERPYISHLLAVSSLVLEGGGDEEQAIAGLLHDALEDQGDKTSYAELEDRFGSRVAGIVRACSDTEVLPKPPWRERKQAYLDSLQHEGADVLLVSAADKLHNARATLTDTLYSETDVWSRFKAGRTEQEWYYRALVEVFEERLPHNPVVRELSRTVDALFSEPR
ncbi:HD domain-containing protein [Ornithinimicrobium pratense]|uniref:HD domain-containing protein n=1 Tax=Ornithinimicrobium pratense TaxID=2593973 RepID=A0A5J6V7Z8_9MICO|nr:HD domain-containing protein [Ornithinimicrobium pratense]QFG69236.1 HD domain-containing protein [Ornithinimicrobium pratense]